MKFLEHPVYYLESSDVDSDGNIINPSIPKDKPILIMLQSLFCGHCTVAKPEFQKLASSQKDVICLTVQGDASPSEVDLAKLLMKKTASKGFPSYIKYKGGKLSTKSYSGDRKSESLYKFAIEN
jgi:thiol-disulfide isomerase/thioredoxin